MVSSFKWLLEDDRWKQCGDGYEDIDEFLDTIDFSDKKIVIEDRKEIAKKLSDLRATQRTIAKSLGVSQSTVGRDVEPNGSKAKEKPSLTVDKDSSYETGENEVDPNGSNTPPPFLSSSGEGAAKVAAKQTNKQWEKEQKRAQYSQLPKPELPPGQYNVIYADPPWEYRNSGFAMSAENQYPTMSTDEICELAVPVAENAICFMWVTNPLLADGLRVLEAWGFDYKTCMVWVKDHHTAGFYVYGQHELLLIGTRGTHMTPTDEAKPKSVITGENKEHSRKPDVVYEIIERMYPDSVKLEMFARRNRKGWTSYGNENN